MKTIGLLGGMSWESSIEYYRPVNEEVRERLGSGTTRLHAPRAVELALDAPRAS